MLVTDSRHVLVPVERVDRWFANFATRHGEASYVVTSGALHASAPDGATAVARLPFEKSYDGPSDVAAFAVAGHAPARWGVLLARKGGFAVARVEQDRIAESKVGQRHVQGRTKAGGQSQQRFARRRDNQARQAYEAAAEHATRILGGVDVVVCAVATARRWRRCSRTPDYVAWLLDGSTPGSPYPILGGRCSSRPSSTPGRSRSR